MQTDDLIDLREPAPNEFDELVGPGPLASALEAAYAARLDAVLHGSLAVQAASRQAVDDLERACLERRRQRGGVPRVMAKDPSYYLG